MPKVMTLARIIDFVEGLENNGNASLERFKSRFDSNPAYEFRWGETAMFAAAQLDVAAYVREWLKLATNRMELETDEGRAVCAAKIIQHATGEVLRVAAMIGQSTSVCSNTMERFTNAVWAQLAQKAFDTVRFSS